MYHPVGCVVPTHHPKPHISLFHKNSQGGIAGTARGDEIPRRGEAEARPKRKGRIAQAILALECGSTPVRALQRAILKAGSPKRINNRPIPQELLNKPALHAAETKRSRTPPRACLRRQGVLFGPGLTAFGAILPSPSLGQNERLAARYPHPPAGVNWRSQEGGKAPRPMAKPRARPNGRRLFRLRKTPTTGGRGR